MKSLKLIVSFVALAVRAWGHTCSAPTPVLSPAIIPVEENHEAIRLPNGWTAIIGHQEMMVTSAMQWVWDSLDAARFPYLDRRAVLVETCSPGPGGCPITQAVTAQDCVTSPNPGVYTMFDDGNGRYASSYRQSRGLVFEIDEAALQVTGVRVYPLHVCSPSSGSAQLLTKETGCSSPAVPGTPRESISQQFEFTPAASVPLWTETLPEQYRVVRLSSLFSD
jgi:hypothetical protein